MGPPGGLGLGFRDFKRDLCRCGVGGLGFGIWGFATSLKAAELWLGHTYMGSSVN